MSKSLFQKPIEIKISTVVAVSAILSTADSIALDAALAEMTGGTADFFEDDLTVIDVAALPAGCGQIDWGGLIALLKKYRLKPVAVRNAPPELADEIAAHGLTLEPANAKPREEETPKPAAAPAPVARRAEPVARRAAPAVERPAAARVETPATPSGPQPYTAPAASTSRTRQLNTAPAASTPAPVVTTPAAPAITVQPLN